MKLTLITLNYNGAESTIKLLESLQNQTNSDFSIIVADNGSADIQKIRDYSADKLINILENGANLGFGGGCNIAMKKALKMGADWLVLLNNDTWVEKDFIGRLRAVLEHTSGLVGLPIDEGKGEIAMGGRLKWLSPTLSHNHGYLNNKRGAHKNRKNIRYAIGGGMAIDSSAIKKIGYFDENYFLYFEDADLSIRAHRADVPIIFPTEPIIHHTVSTSTRKLGSPLLLRYHYRNALYFNFNRGPLLIKILAIFWSLVITAKQLLKILNKNHPTESKAILAGVIDFYQEKMGRISTKIKVGFECESIEGKNPQWGIGRIIMKTLEEIANRPELAKEFEFTLYFKDNVPDFPFLKSPLFKTKTAPVPGHPGRWFPIYYLILLPIRLWLDRNDVMFWSAYMLPVGTLTKSFALMTEDVYYEAFKSKASFQHRFFYGIFGSYSAKFATKLLAISETSKRNVAEVFKIDPDRITVNHLGVDPLSSIKNQVLSIKQGNYILYVGQAFPRRHLRETMQAFRKIALEFPDLSLIIIGPDKYPTPTIAPLIQEINTALGREAVIHKEHIPQEELDQYYAGAKALVYVSDREAFGLPPMEALAFGVPSVITDNALGHELFGDNAVFVSRPDSMDSIATALREAMTNSLLREKIKEHASGIVSRYTWQAHTDRFLEIIKSMTHE